jgi:hypothetical protein
MGFLEAIATAFFRTFGITQPTEAKRRRATLFFFGILILIVFAIATATIMIFHNM